MAGEEVTQVDGTFDSCCGYQLKRKSCLVQNPKAALCLVHGYAEHHKPYASTMKTLNEHGFSVYTYDQVGHGESGGPRAVPNKFETYVTDLLCLVDLVRVEVPGIPVFLVGHSMGGLVCALAGVEKPDLVQGVVFISPLFGVDPEVEAAVVGNPIKSFMARTLNRFYPSARLVDICLDTMCRDKQVMDEYKADELTIHGKVPVRFAMCCKEGITKLNMKMDLVTYPFLLLLAGADKIVYNPASTEFHQKASSKDKTLETFPGFYHQLHKEPGEDKQKVLDVMANWILQRAKSAE